MTKKAAIRSLSSMARSFSGQGRDHLAGRLRATKPAQAVYTWLANHVGEPLPRGTVITFPRHARAVTNEGIEAAFRGILARHGRPEARCAHR